MSTRNDSRAHEIDPSLSDGGVQRPFPPARVTYMIDHLYGVEGGGERALLRIIRHLPRNRFRPSVVTFDVMPRTIEILRELDCPLSVFPIRHTYDWDGLQTALRIRSFLRAQRPDIVHTFFESSNTWGGLITKLSFGPLLVSSRRDMGILRSNKHRIAYKLVNILSDGVLAVSKEVRRICVEMEGINPDKVFTVYNGIDIAKVDSVVRDSLAKLKYGLGGASHIVTTVANIREVKGLDTLLRTADIVRRKFESVLFVIVGYPNERPYFNELQHLVKDLGLECNVRFLGPVEDVFSLLKISDVFCLLSRSEGFSNALLEAMACELPCVATRVGGNPEAITDGADGFLVPTENPAAAAYQVASLLEKPEYAKGIGRKARKTVESNFTVKIMIEQLTTLYENLLKPSRMVRQTN
jgi:glycosyltransferase involved in cell wall biosynthesis